MSGNWNPYPYDQLVASEPLAGLPIEMRKTFLHILLVQSATLGFVLWDIANSAAWDFKLARRSDWRNYRTALMNLCYYAARWLAFGFGLTATLSITIPQDDCTIMPKVYGVLAGATVITTAIVFAWRVIALWAYDRRITVFVIFAFLPEFAFACTGVVKSGGQHIPFSPYCYANYNARPWLVGASISIFVFDSVVAALTIYKLAAYSKTNPLRFARDANVPPLSRLLIQGGVVYYLIATATNIVAVVMWVSPFDDSHALLHVFWTVPGLGIQACMAAKVFRLIRRELAAPNAVAQISDFHPAGTDLRIAARSTPGSSPVKSSLASVDWVPTLSKPPAAYGVTLTQQFDSFTEKADPRYAGPRKHRFSIYPPDVEADGELDEKLDDEEAESTGSLTLGPLERRPSAPFSGAVPVEEDHIMFFSSRQPPEQA